MNLQLFREEICCEYFNTKILGWQFVKICADRTTNVHGLFAMELISIEGNVILPKMTTFKSVPMTLCVFPTVSPVRLPCYLHRFSGREAGLLARIVLTAAHVNDNFGRWLAWNITPFHQIFFCVSCQFPTLFYYLLAQRCIVARKRVHLM